jgi:hypothetical protein
MNKQINKPVAQAKHVLKEEISMARRVCTKNGRFFAVSINVRYGKTFCGGFDGCHCGSQRSFCDPIFRDGHGRIKLTRIVRIMGAMFAFPVIT